MKTGQFPSLSMAGLALILIAAACQPAQPVAPASPATLGPTIALDTPTPTPAGQPGPESGYSPTTAPTVTSPWLPGVQFVLAAPFPTAPAEVMLYQQEFPAQPLSPGAARQAALELGIMGAQVYRSQGEGAGQTVLIASDGRSQVTFIDTTDRFYWVKDYSTVLNSGGPMAPYDLQETSALEFLQGNNLLAGAYQVEVLNDNRGNLRFLPLLDDRAVRYSAFEAPPMDVRIDPQGNITALDLTRLQVIPVGLTSVLSAQAAWQSFLAGDPATGIETAWKGSEGYTLQTWQRSYPTGERVELFGYGSVLQAIEPGLPSLVTFNNLTVSGKNTTAFADSLRLGQFIQAWGQIVAGSGGLLTFEVEGWQTSALPDLVVEGVIEHQGDQVFLNGDAGGDGKAGRLRLVDVPGGVAAGLAANVRGVLLEGPEPTLEWWLIQAGSTGAWPQRGPGQFHPLGSTLQPIAPSPTPAPPLPYGLQAGQPLSGLEGWVTVQYQQDANGQSQPRAYFEAVQELGGVKAVYQYAIALPLPAGLEELHNLPARLWARVTGEVNPYGLPILEVDRYEERVPGLHYQAWLGSLEAASLDGKAVIVLNEETTRQKYVLLDTHWEDQPIAEMTGRPGEQVLVEGIALPGKRLNGLPAIQVRSMRTIAGLNLDEYLGSLNTPALVESSTEPIFPAGEARVETVELVYWTPDLRPGPLPAGSDPIWVQPAWRFSGHYSSGEAFEIFIQALPGT